jgi:hemerythrin-like domain-containing protein
MTDDSYDPGPVLGDETVILAATGDAGAPDGCFSVVPTPDDGSRLSPLMPWDESSRPEAPAPDGARTYTAHQQAIGQHLVDVHDMLRAELEQLREIVDQVAAGTVGVGSARSHIQTLTMRQNNWTLGTYCQAYCRLVTGHHSLEDASVFPHLQTREPALRPVLDRLRDEHLVIHDVLESVDRALVQLVMSGDDTTSLRSAMDLLTDTLLSHLSYEERSLVEPLARLGFS